MLEPHRTWRRAAARHGRGLTEGVLRRPLEPPVAGVPEGPPSPISWAAAYSDGAAGTSVSWR